jgi:hypothetical protein
MKVDHGLHRRKPGDNTKIDIRGRVGLWTEFDWLRTFGYMVMKFCVSKKRAIP